MSNPSTDVESVLLNDVVKPMFGANISQLNNQVPVGTGFHSRLAKPNVEAVASSTSLSVHEDDDGDDMNIFTLTANPTPWSQASARNQPPTSRPPSPPTLSSSETGILKLTLNRVKELENKEQFLADLHQQELDRLAQEAALREATLKRQMAEQFGRQFAAEKAALEAAAAAKVKATEEELIRKQAEIDAVRQQGMKEINMLNHKLKAQAITTTPAVTSVNVNESGRVLANRNDLQSYAKVAKPNVSATQVQELSSQLTSLVNVLDASNLATLQNLLKNAEKSLYGGEVLAPAPKITSIQTKQDLSLFAPEQFFLKNKDKKLYYTNLRIAEDDRYFTAKAERRSDNSTYSVYITASIIQEFLRSVQTVMERAQTSIPDTFRMESGALLEIVITEDGLALASFCPKTRKREVCLMLKDVVDLAGVSLETTVYSKALHYWNSFATSILNELAFRGEVSRKVERKRAKRQSFTSEMLYLREMADFRQSTRRFPIRGLSVLATYAALGGTVPCAGIIEKLMIYQDFSFHGLISHFLIEASDLEKAFLYWPGSSLTIGMTEATENQSASLVVLQKDSVFNKDWTINDRGVCYETFGLRQHLTGGLRIPTTKVTDPSQVDAKLIEIKSQIQSGAATPKNPRGTRFQPVNPLVVVSKEKTDNPNKEDGRTTKTENTQLRSRSSSQVRGSNSIKLASNAPTAGAGAIPKNKTKEVIRADENAFYTVHVSKDDTISGDALREFVTIINPYSVQLLNAVQTWFSKNESRPDDVKVTQLKAMLIALGTELKLYITVKDEFDTLVKFAWTYMVHLDDAYKGKFFTIKFMRTCEEMQAGYALIMIYQFLTRREDLITGDVANVIFAPCLTSALGMDLKFKSTIVRDSIHWVREHALAEARKIASAPV